MTRLDDDGRASVLVAEDDLRAMFARRRVDAAAFSAGVAERLAAAQAPDDEDGDNGSEVAPVARFAPRVMIDRAAAWLGAPMLGTGKIGAGKSFLAIVTWPCLLLLGVVVTFVHSFRGVDPAHHTERPMPSPRARATHGRFVQLLPSIGSVLAIVAMLAYVLFGGGVVTDLLTLALMLGMMAIAWHIGQTARSGVVSSVQVARTIALLLLAAVMGCWAWLSSVRVFDGDSIFGHRAVGWVLWLGAVGACLLGSWQQRGRDPGLGVILCFVLPVLGAVALELPSHTESRVRQSIGGLELNPQDLRNWGGAGVIANAIDAAGLEQLPLPVVRERLAKAVAKGDDPHPQVWSTAVHLGLLSPGQLQEIAQRGSNPNRLDDLLEEDGPLRLQDFDYYLLECLLATRDVAAEDREHLVERLRASWPEPHPTANVIEQARECARWLDRLGRRDVILEHREELHRLLRDHHVTAANARTFSAPGGFCTFLENGYYSNITTTARAVALMEFVGPPEGVSLHHVHAFLRNSFNTSLLGRAIGGGTVLRLEAEAAMLELERGVGLPERDWLTALVGERTLVAALLLALLALRAIRIAHVSERSLVGALP